MRRMRWLLAVAALSAAACLDDPTGGRPGGSGTLLLRLTSPHTDDGALLFELTGPGIDSVEAVNASVRLFTRRANDAMIVAAVVGALTNGAVVMLRVPDVGATAEYRARILEVADRENRLRASLTAYALTVNR